MLVEELLGHVRKCSTAHDGGIEDEDVELAEGTDCLVQETLRALGGSDVGLHANGFAGAGSSARVDRVDDGSGGGCVGDVVNDDICAVCSETSSDGCSD